MSSISEAFAKVCKDAIRPSEGCFYVVLYRKESFYGGPEEGGWWGENIVVEAFQRFDSEDAAEQAADAVYKMAEELTREAAMAHGRGCLAQLEWCEARGIDDSDSVFGEGDGPDTYRVVVQSEPPQSSYGDRDWS